VNSIADQMRAITDHLETVVTPQAECVSKRLVQADLTKVVTAAIEYAQQHAENDMCLLDELADRVAAMEDENQSLAFEERRLTEDNLKLRREIALLKLKWAMVG